jgi:hypothetical protein
MKEQIINNIENASELERLYRLNPGEFSKDFNDAYDFIKEHPIAEFWLTRLKFDTITGQELQKDVSESETQPETSNKRFAFVFTVIASLVAGTIAKMPDFLGMGSDQYLMDNAAFFVLPLLSIFYIIKNRLSTKSIIIFSVIVIVSIIFINLLPGDNKSDTHMLSSMHLVLLMWVVLGVVFIGENIMSPEKQLQFIKRNGDVIILTSVILCGGVVLTGLI